MIRDQPTPVDNMPNPTLTTVFTTQTFTASQVLESFMTGKCRNAAQSLRQSWLTSTLFLTSEEPWITTIERMTTWTVTDTVTMEVPAPTP